VSNGDAEAQLPDTIKLDMEEALVVLSALDRAADMGEPGSAYHRMIRGAIRLMTRKLWPDLGRLLDEDEE
jgi:hypothetical protein